MACPICLSFLTGNTSCGICGHVFHTECIAGWIKVRSKCPICRQEMEKHDLRKIFLSSAEELERQLKTREQSDISADTGKDGFSESVKRLGMRNMELQQQIAELRKKEKQFVDDLMQKTMEVKKNEKNVQESTDKIRHYKEKIREMAEKRKQVEKEMKMMKYENDIGKANYSSSDLFVSSINEKLASTSRKYLREVIAKQHLMLQRFAKEKISLAKKYEDALNSVSQMEFENEKLKTSIGGLKSQIEDTNERKGDFSGSVNAKETLNLKSALTGNILFPESKPLVPDGEVLDLTLRNLKGNLGRGASHTIFGVPESISEEVNSMEGPLRKKRRSKVPDSTSPTGQSGGGGMGWFDKVGPSSIVQSVESRGGTHRKVGRSVTQVKRRHSSEKRMGPTTLEAFLGGST